MLLKDRGHKSMFLKDGEVIKDCYWGMEIGEGTKACF